MGTQIKGSNIESGAVSEDKLANDSVTLAKLNPDFEAGERHKKYLQIALPQLPETFGTDTVISQAYVPNGTAGTNWFAGCVNGEIYGAIFNPGHASHQPYFDVWAGANPFGPGEDITAIAKFSTNLLHSQNIFGGSEGVLGNINLTSGGQPEITELTSPFLNTDPITSIAVGPNSSLDTLRMVIITSTGKISEVAVNTYTSITLGTSPVVTSLNKVAHIKFTGFIIVGDNGKILKNDSNILGGITWDVITNPFGVTTKIYDVYFSPFSTGDIVACGENGEIATSSDYGATWTLNANVASTYSSVTFVSVYYDTVSTRWYFMDLAGTIYFGPAGSLPTGPISQIRSLAQVASGGALNYEVPVKMEPIKDFISYDLDDKVVIICADGNLRYI